MKQVIKTAIAVALIVIMSTMTLPVFAGDASSQFSNPNPYVYDTEFWNYTSYEDEVIILNVYLFSNPKSQLIGKVYIFPYMFQPDKYVDKRILQCVAYKLKVAPQIFTVPGTGTKYVGMVNDISVAVTNIQDEDEMQSKVITPNVTLESTVMNGSYTASVGSEWGFNGGIQAKNGEWSFSVNDNYAHKTTVSQTTQYTKSALSVASIDYNDSTKTADWCFKFATDMNQVEVLNRYATSTTYQLGAIGWMGRKNAGYYYSNFQFEVEAGFALADYITRVRTNLDSRFPRIFGRAKIKSDSYAVFSEDTVFVH